VIVSTATAEIFLDVFRDFPAPVLITVLVSSTDASGVPTKEIGRAFYPKLALTSHGSGYFPQLYAGGIIPITEISTGNPGDRTDVQVTLLDSSSHKLVQPQLATSFWNRVQPASAIVALGITSASVTTDGMSIEATGKFPINQMLTAEVAVPEMDNGVVFAASKDGKKLVFQIPTSIATGFPLYPSGYSAGVMWSLTLTAPDGASVTALGILTVVGTFGKPGVAMVQ
jgi:hypothetical protein